MLKIKDIFRLFHVKYIQNKSCGNPQIKTRGRILIVAPHPDDEVIGCGGLIAQLVSEGRTPHIIIMTGGEGSHRSCCLTSDNDIKTARRRLTRHALNILGVKEEYIHELDFPDGGISATHPEADKLSCLISKISPDIIFVPHWGEGWPDHVNTAEIIKDMVSANTHIYEYCVWMWYYNVWRGLNWKNAFRQTMTQEEHRLKLAAMDAYIKPLAPCGKPWSGDLPDIFINANSGNTELYFKVI